MSSAQVFLKNKKNKNKNTLLVSLSSQRPSQKRLPITPVFIPLSVLPITMCSHLPFYLGGGDGGWGAGVIRIRLFEWCAISTCRFPPHTHTYIPVMALSCWAHTLLLHLPGIWYSLERHGGGWRADLMTLSLSLSFVLSALGFPCL